MSDAQGEILGLVREAMASLQGLDASSPASARAWAQRHFAALVAIERGLGRRPAATPAVDPIGAVHGALVRAIRAFFSGPDDGDPIGAALGALMELAGAERGFVAIREADGALAFPSARSFSAVELGRPEAEVSRTILDVAIRGGERPLQIDDASADARFAGQPSVQRLALRAVLVIPLVHDQRAYGVVYLDHPGEAAAFDPRRREAAEAFASAAAPRLWSARQRLGAGPQAPASRLAALRRDHDLAGLVGDGPAITLVLERALAVAPTDAPVLISGESGVGKGLLAALLRRNSRRADGPVVELRCASAAAEALATGLRAALVGARGGTLILDEIDALSAAHQGALAAELDRERGRADGARILAIRRQSRPAPGAEEALRAELRFRVGVVEIEVPPLRERAGDLEALAAHTLRALAARDGGRPRALAPGALACLENYPWPGNVRELANVLEGAALATADVITPEHLPERLRAHEILGPSSDAGLKEAVRAFRRRFVERVMAESGADHKQAAATLGVHPKYLYKLLRELREEE